MSICTICRKEHDNIWISSTPNMYCSTCLPIRQNSRGVISHIVGNLYLSDMIGAGNFDGARLCVHEMTPTYEGQYHHIPILSKKPNGPWDRTGAIVSVEALIRAMNLIEEYVERNERLLIHCHGGIERSPLTLACYLVRSKAFGDLDQAYEFIRTKRPVVSDRRFWLPQSV